MRLILIALMVLGSTSNAEEYFCPVSKKLNSDSSYSAAQLQQWMFSVKIKQCIAFQSEDFPLSQTDRDEFS